MPSMPPVQRVDDGAVEEVSGDTGGGELKQHPPTGISSCHGQPYRALIDTITRTVADSTIGPERSPAAPHRIKECFNSNDVEKRVLLTGKAGVRQIFSSRG